MQVLLLGTFGEANESEMTAIRKIVCYSQFPGWWGGTSHPAGATWGSTRASDGIEGIRGKCGQQPLFGSLREGMGKNGKQT